MPGKRRKKVFLFSSSLFLLCAPHQTMKKNTHLVFVLDLITQRHVGDFRFEGRVDDLSSVFLFLFLCRVE